MGVIRCGWKIITIGQSKIMIEAPGYMPVISAAFTKPGWYTNDFALKKGQGIVGTIVSTNGEPSSIAVWCWLIRAIQLRSAER